MKIKLNNSIKYLVCIGLLCFNLIGNSQMNISYNTDIFKCTNVNNLGFVDASFDCNFNGTLSLEVFGDPEQTFHVFEPLEVTNGNFTFQYDLKAVAPSSIDLNWTIETSDDVTGCASVGNVASSTILLDCICAPVIKVFPVMHESCYECADGSITFEASGMQTPINYEWSDGGNMPTNDNLAPGMYTLTVTGANVELCTATTAVTIIEPYECDTTQIEYESSNVSCYADCNGVGNILGLENGNEIETTLWSDGSLELFRDDLCQGNYNVTLRTEDNCPYILELVIQQPDSIAITVGEIVHANGPSTGSITLKVEGGTEPYSYYISLNGVAIDHDSTQSEISMLDAGCYQIGVKDANECIAQLTNICIDNISSVEAVSNTVFKTFPNPCVDYLMLESDENLMIKSISIFDLTGKKHSVNLNNKMIDVSQLTNGIYFVYIETESDRFFKRIVKGNDY